MSKKVIIFIGEGSSEYAFFDEFMQKYYGFKKEGEKNSILLSKGDIYILLGHPKIGSSHKGGEDQLKSCLPYAIINKKIESYLYKFGKSHEFERNYILLTDGDTKKHEEKKIIVETNIQRYCSTFPGILNIAFSEKEIESWFVAGIGKNIQEKYQLDPNKIHSLISTSNIDTINDIKEIFKEIIKGSALDGNQEYIGREFGKNIDIENAKVLSNSFIEFINTIENILQ